MTDAMSRGYKAEVLVGGSEWCQNGVVWPDKASAAAAALDLFSRWTLTTSHRVVESHEAPNRPTWAKWTEKRGLPPRSVQL